MEPFLELIEQGGPVFAVIVLLSVLMWVLIFERYWHLYLIHPKNLKRSLTNWELRVDHSTWCARQIRTGMIADLSLDLKEHLLLVRALTLVLPLLGLLGTVIGMITTFDAMTFFGTSNTRGFTGGISQALLTTAAGLVTSISGLYFSAHLEHMARKKIQNAAGLIGL